MLINEFANPHGDQPNKKASVNEYSTRNDYKELESGFPNPSKYDHYMINKYSFPKGLTCSLKTKESSPK